MGKTFVINSDLDLKYGAEILEPEYWDLLFITTLWPQNVTLMLLMENWLEGSVDKIYQIAGSEKDRSKKKRKFKRKWINLTPFCKA